MKPDASARGLRRGVLFLRRLFQLASDRRAAGDGADVVVRGQAIDTSVVDEAMKAYREWVAQQHCIDCGRSVPEIREQEKGKWTMMTETQCYKCWKEKGAPENRGLPSARDKYLKDGGGVIW